MAKSSASSVADNHTITAIQAAKSLKQAIKAQQHHTLDELTFLDIL